MEMQFTGGVFTIFQIAPNRFGGFTYTIHSLSIYRSFWESYFLGGCAMTVNDAVYPKCMFDLGFLIADIRGMN